MKKLTFIIPVFLLFFILVVPAEAFTGNLSVDNSGNLNYTITTSQSEINQAVSLYDSAAGAFNTSHGFDQYGYDNSGNLDGLQRCDDPYSSFTSPYYWEPEFSFFGSDPTAALNDISGHPAFQSQIQTDPPSNNITTTTSISSLLPASGVHYPNPTTNGNTFLTPQNITVALLISSNINSSNGQCEFNYPIPNLIYLNEGLNYLADPNTYITIPYSSLSGSGTSFTEPALTNNQPTIGPITNVQINEGSTYSENNSFTDPDSTSWTATVDYGDGSVSQPLTLSGMTFSLNHIYKDNGTYTVTVSITDNQGTTGTAAGQITVKNVAPTVNTISVSANPAQVNTATSASASFTDPGINDTHTATWNWGDGNTTTGTVTENKGSGSVSDNHTYTSPGIYQITLTVTDNQGASSTQTFQYISVYDPTSQGLFSADSKFISPLGAYMQNTSLSGNVKFGLSYKYHGTVPKANKEFSMDFNQANLHFNASSVKSLVISNGIGILTGIGSVNGSGTYNFFVTGNGNADTIRIQIKDQSGRVIYDTQPGDSATATPITPVVGNVLVH